MKIKQSQLGQLIFLLFLCSSFGCASRKVANNTEMDIYILMGQSNMAGRGPLSAADSTAPNKKVLMLTQSLAWIPAKNPVHFDKPKVTGVGPGLAFGLAMQKNNPSKNIGLVATAVGGTSINSWTPGGYDKATKKYPYDDAEKRILAAMKTGVVKGVIWHQGESDSNPDSAKIYLPKLIKLIERVRQLTNNPSLPFVVGELGTFKPNHQNINIELSKLPAMVKHTAVASSINLHDKGDKLHFDAKSANLLGQNFADEMLQLQMKNKF